MIDHLLLSVLILVYISDLLCDLIPNNTDWIERVMVSLIQIQFSVSQHLHNYVVQSRSSNNYNLDRLYE